MMRNAITVRRGLLVGAAVGVALVVMWRRSREARDEVVPAAPPEPAVEPEVRAEEPAVHAETETFEPAPIAPDRVQAEHTRHAVALTHLGRPRDLSAAGWPQPRRVAVLGATGRTHRPPTRAAWPGVAGARRGAFTLGR
jgi:predicted membrane-bound mannosyltransferase